MIRPSLARLSSINFTLVFSISVFAPVLSFGQSPAAGSDVTITTTPAKTQKVSDLAARYRFLERYSADDAKSIPGVVASYRVAIVETNKESVEVPQGTPKRSENSRQSIFTECAAEMNGIGNVTALTRTYERFKAKPGDILDFGGVPLEGVSVLVRSKLAELPDVLSLVDNRPLTEFEFDVITHQMFIPQVAMLLPAQVVRIGDTWKVTRRVAQSLLGDSSIVGDGLVAKLTEIKKEVDGPRSVATIEVSGKLITPIGENTLNAEVTFTFIGESSLKSFSSKKSFIPRPTEDITEARGSITEIRLARSITGLIPNSNRLRYFLNREVTMHRQIGLVEGAPAAPKLKMIPDPTPANSWLTHLDPDYRFSIQHPQDLLLPERNLLSTDSNTVYMMRQNREGRDMLQVEFLNKVVTAEELRKQLDEKYKLFKTEVIKGNDQELPKGDWAPNLVHRIDAELKLADPKAAASVGATRIHFDGYLIQYPQGSSTIAIASTTKEAIAPFRKEMEKILKTIQIDPKKPTIK